MIRRCACPKPDLLATMQLLLDCGTRDDGQPDHEWDAGPAAPSGGPRPPAAHPELAIPLVEEVLRYDPPVQFRTRTTLAEMPIAGRHHPQRSHGRPGAGLGQPRPRALLRTRAIRSGTCRQRTPWFWQRGPLLCWRSAGAAGSRDRALEVLAPEARGPAPGRRPASLSPRMPPCVARNTC